MSISPELLNAIEQYLAGKATDEEIRVVNTWYHSFNDENVVIATTESDLISKIELRLKERLLKSTGITIEKPTVTPTKSIAIMLTRYAAAAAVLLFIGWGTYFLTGHKTQEVIIAQNTDIKPGGNRAILRLAGGKTIVLNNASNGVIARQGTLTINKSAGGQIAYNDAESRQQATGNDVLSTPNGGMYHVTLSDGTGIWLNAATTISYPQKFTGNRREVELSSGEAYFEVAHDKSKPFFVNVKGQSVEVLGTHFDINTYQDEGDIQTTLLQGSIRLKKGTNVVVLKPGQMARTAEHAKDVIIVANVDTDGTLAWKNELFKFDNTSLHTVMKQLARWYSVEVKFEGNVSNVRFSGGTVMNKNLSEVLKVLELNGIHFRVEGRTIIVLP